MACQLNPVFVLETDMSIFLIKINNHAKILTNQMNINHITKKLSTDSYQLSEKKLTANSYKLKADRGFTLVEMLVSISVFLVVMLVAASSLLSIIDGNAKAQSLKSAINNLNFALESMQKNIRVGKDYPTSSGSIFQFTSYEDSDNSGANDTVIYKLIGESIKRCVVAGSNSCSGNDKFTTITAPEVHIDYINFYPSVSGTENPRVLIVVGGYAGEKERIKTKFNLQTTVSQRPF